MFTLLHSFFSRYLVPGFIGLIAVLFLQFGQPALAASNSSEAVLPKFVPMKNMTLTEVTTETIVNGLTISASEFTSTDTIEAIAKHYTREWEKAGFEKPLVELTSEALGMFTAGENHLYSLKAVKTQGEKRFGGVKSQGRLMVSVQLERAKASTATAFPLLTGNTVSTRMVNKDEGRETETLLISSSASMVQNIAFLIDRLEKDGWELNTDIPVWLDPAKGRIITGQHQNAYINISITPPSGGNDKFTSILVNWTR